MSQKIYTNLDIKGNATIGDIANATSDTDKFLVSDAGVVKYRTGAEMLSDLGVAPGVATNVQHQVKAGVAINKGQAVYVTDADGTNMIVGLASNYAEATSSKTMGLINATVSINGFANVITEGLLAGLNTLSANAGDPVWLGTNGNLIYGLANKPYAPSHLVFIGIVTRVNANNGEIFVKVQNGFELDELHNVDLQTTIPINGHILGYNGTLWVNKTIAGWLGYTPANDARTISTTSPLQGGGDLSANRTLSISQANSTTNGYLSSTDWSTFNNKQNALGYTAANDSNVVHLTGNETITGFKTFSPTISASGAIARGTYLTPSLTATANNDVLVGLDIAPTFTNGAFTGVTNVGIRTMARLQILRSLSVSNQYMEIETGLGNNGTITSYSQVGNAKGFTLNSTTDTLNTTPTAGTNNINLAIRGVSALYIQDNRNVQIGTSIDSGYKFDVAGSTRLNGLQTFQGTTASDTAPLGSELTTTATGTNWTGTSFATGYTHTVGSTVALTSTLAASIGTYYQITYTITGRTAGSITINYGGTTINSATATGATGPLATATTVLSVTPTTDFDGTLVLSIKSIGTSSATTTFTTSGGVISNEIRASNINSNYFSGYNSGKRNTTGLQNAFIGTNSGMNNTTGNNNTAVGISALAFNNIGSNNSILGYAGLSNTAYGSNNVAIGYNSGRYIADKSTSATILHNSVLLGYLTSPLADNQTNQIVIGYNSTGLGSNTTVLGNSSTTQAGVYGSLLISNSGGVLPAYNATYGLRIKDRDAEINDITVGKGGGGGNAATSTSIGVSVLQNNTTGFANTGLGFGALASNTSGNTNTGIGYAAMFNNATGSTNTALGTSSGRYIGDKTTSATILNNSIMLGYRTSPLADNQTNQIVIGHDATGLGSNTTVLGNSSTTQAGVYGSLLISNSGGVLPAYNATYGLRINGRDAEINDITIGKGGGNISSNTSVGYLSLLNNTTGANNTSVGYQALFGNLTGNNNNSFGQYSLNKNTTGNSNIAIGYVSLYSNTTGNNNVANGNQALYNNTIGVNNVANGYQALYSNTTGNNNVANGTLSGRYISDKSTAATILNNSIMLGYQTSPLADNQTNQIVIGYDAIGLGSNTSVIGNSSTTQAGIYGRLLLSKTSTLPTDDGTTALQVNGSVKVADDTTAASSANVGAIRYRSDANNSYMDMVMQTGASTYAWINVVQNNW